MRYMVGLFVESEFKEAFNTKVKEVQKADRVSNDYETDVNGKRIKLWLPERLKEQYRAVLLAETFMIKEFISNTEDVYKLRMEIFDIATSHMLIDGKKDFSIDTFTFDMIDMIIMLYVTELLLPLYLWSSMRVGDKFKTSLTSYIKG